MHVRFVIDDIPWTWTFPGTTTALARAVRRGALPLDRFPSWTGPAPRYEGSLEPGDPETDDEVTVRTGTVWSAIAFLGDDTVRWSASRDDLGQAAPEIEVAEDPALTAFLAGLEVPPSAKELVFAMGDGGKHLEARTPGRSGRSLGTHALSAPLEGHPTTWSDHVVAMLKASFATGAAADLLGSRPRVPVAVIHEDIGDIEWDGVLTPEGLA
ncbi:MAG: hypothetical protein H6734_17700 [Alphaproteobacteria bacterium]|nr:hypothetical protein [Alphaproteobacteria bacterium]